MAAAGGVVATMAVVSSVGGDEGGVGGVRWSRWWFKDSDGSGSRLLVAMVVAALAASGDEDDEMKAVRWWREGVGSSGGCGVSVGVAGWRRRRRKTFLRGRRVPHLINIASTPSSPFPTPTSCEIPAMLRQPHRRTLPHHHLHPPLRTITTIPNIKQPPSPRQYHLHRTPPPTAAAITNIITPHTTTAPPNTTSTAAGPSSTHHQGAPHLINIASTPSSPFPAPTSGEISAMFRRPHRRTPPPHHLHPPLRTIPNIKRPPSPRQYHLHRTPPPSIAAITNIITSRTTKHHLNSSRTIINSPPRVRVVFLNHRGCVWFYRNNMRVCLVRRKHHEGAFGLTETPQGVCLLAAKQPLGCVWQPPHHKGVFVYVGNTTYGAFGFIRNAAKGAFGSAFNYL
nr:hypothetical protein [Tanacetum cinerariifolium]